MYYKIRLVANGSTLLYAATLLQLLAFGSLPFCTLLQLCRKRFLYSHNVIFNVTIQSSEEKERGEEEGGGLGVEEWVQ